MTDVSTYDEMMQRIKALEEENHFYKCLMDAFPVNVFVKDTECRYGITSRICDVENGVERGALRGKTDFDIMASREIAQGFYEDDLKIMREKLGSRIFSPTVFGDTVKYYDIFREPILDDDGEVLGILGMVIDPGKKVLTQSKEKSGADKYPEYYASENHFMIDYNFFTNETIILAKPNEYDFLPEVSYEFLNLLIRDGYIDNKTSMLIKAALLEISRGQSEISLIIDFKDKSGNKVFAKVKLTALYGRDEDVSRALIILHTIDEDDLFEEKRELIMRDVKSHFCHSMSESFEKIIFVSPMRGWYQIMKNDTSDYSLKETGSYEDIKRMWENMLDSKDWAQFYEMYHREDLVRSGRRPGINTMRVRSRVADDTYRWKEIAIFAEACEEDERAFIVAIADVEDDVREENRIKRHGTNRQIIDVLSTIVEYRDLESGEHIRRIRNLSEILLTEYSKDNDERFSDEDIKIISAAAAMHDIGKIAIPDTILLKPGRLTHEEYENMKEHTVKGSELVRTVAAIQDKDYAKYCYEICRYHHERYDGKGYPDGLKGEEIPIAAQIVSVVDVFDALVTKRCYKEAYDMSTAYNMILNGECGTFSDNILACFIKCRDKIEELYV